MAHHVGTVEITVDHYLYFTNAHFLLGHKMNEISDSRTILLR